VSDTDSWSQNVVALCHLFHLFHLAFTFLFPHTLHVVVQTWSAEPGFTTWLARITRGPVLSNQTCLDYIPTSCFRPDLGGVSTCGVVGRRPEGRVCIRQSSDFYRLPQR
jgi:hypothetical protein